MRSIPWFLALAASLAGCGPGGSSDTVGPAPDPTQAEARYRKAREVDLAQPLMPAPGAPMCPDLAQV